MRRPIKTLAFATRVVRWQKKHGRHDLPWQRARNPYRIWLAEVMLQQTQVATAAPYYRRFLRTFPNLRSLAEASIDEVLAQWSGLGYYARARNLHRAAREIIVQHGGRFPRTFEAVLSLPGIGRSTAAAICAFAFGAQRAILEGNVKRLLARYFGITGWPGASPIEEQLWRRAESLLPSRNIEAYTQGMMDLGATICTRARPRCTDCPLRAECVARRDGRIAELPTPRPRAPLPHKRSQMLVLLYGDAVLLEKRAANGIWGGLWSLPEARSDEDLIALCHRRYGLEIATPLPLTPITHGFSHFRLDIVPSRCAVNRLLFTVADPNTLWLHIEAALVAGIPAPVRRILSTL
jgi:A/G-specific adenine glycosylase